MMFRIAYGAGHYRETAGRRIPGALDPAQTREWILNDRVARYFALAAQEYQGVSLLRVDDPTGETPISLEDRCRAANEWGADFCLSIHHNAFQGKPWKGGGVEAYSSPGSTRGRRYRDAIYEAVVAAGGLRGNRALPKQEKGYIVLKQTKAPAVLVEYGFMDSETDVPVLLSEGYARAVGCATMAAVAKVAGLQKRELYRVQVGAFSEPENAKKLLEKLKNSGFEGFIVGATQDGR